MIKQFISGFLLFLLLLSQIVFYSCSDEQTFGIGENLVDVKGDVVISDTATIKTYTIKVDSLITEGYEKSLVGKFTDGKFGTIEASSYFRVALPTNYFVGRQDVKAIENGSRFDSICLILKPTGYCYGDSTKQYKLEVHQLMENLNNPDIAKRYNVSKVSYKADVLGTFASTFKPSSGKLLNVRLSDAFGIGLFDLLSKEADEVSSPEDFLDYFKGIALVPDPTSESSIRQFATDSVTTMRLYYHHREIDEYFDFNLTNPEKQYNRIIGDYKNSPLVSLVKQKNVVSSVNTGNVTYCQAGTGVMTKIEFPYLRTLFESYSTYKIMKARLIVRPVHGSYNMVPLPEKLNLYYSNLLNDVGNSVTNAQGTALSSVLYYDNVSGDLRNRAYYAFDLTYYLSNIMLHLTDDAPSILVSLPVDNNSSLDRIMLGDYHHSTNAIKLEITFWKY